MNFKTTSYRSSNGIQEPKQLWEREDRPWAGELCVPRYLQVGAQVPEADLAVVAAGDDDGAVHQQQGGHAVRGGAPAPQHDGQHQAVPGHGRRVPGIPATE